jgi:chromatin assembly factor 1 subunit B
MFAANTLILNSRLIEIGWHRSKSGTVEGIQSCDYHPSENKLLTSGLDKYVRIWRCREILKSQLMQRDQRNVTVDILTRSFQHVASISPKTELDVPSVARWSPQGHLIGVAYLTGEVTVYRKRENPSKQVLEEENAEEQWESYWSTRGPSEVNDISFSPDSQHIVLGNLDGNVLLYNIENYSLVRALQSCHEKKCQGVSVDPWNELVVSAGADRKIKFYSLTNRKKKESHVDLVETSTVGQRAEYKHFSFKGEHSAPYTRRMSWSPDGVFVAVPCAAYKTKSDQEEDAKPKSKPEDTKKRNDDSSKVSSTLLFLRSDLNQPVLAIRSSDGLATVGAKFAPAFFKLNSATAVSPSVSKATAAADEANGQAPDTNWGCGEYDMVLAIWTDSMVEVFSTRSQRPIAVISQIHYVSILDVCFSNDCNILYICSNDGYITAMYLADSVLGEKYNLREEADRVEARGTSPITWNVANKLKRLQEVALEREKKLNGVGRQVHVVGAVRKKRRVEQSDDEDEKDSGVAAKKGTDQQENAQPAVEATADELAACL